MRVDELQQARAQLAEVRATLSQQISDLEDEHKDRNQSRCEDPRFAYYAKYVDIWRNEDESWKMPATVAGFNKEIQRQQNLDRIRAEKQEEAAHQQEKWNNEIKAKLQSDIIKRATREQQVTELRVIGGMKHC